MITLSDERGLIKSPQSWDEIESLPGYVKGLDPSEHKLKEIIGSYHLKDIHCGLTCNQPHDKGYIAVTESGAVTNLGQDCGRKYFGADFTTFANKHHRDLTAWNNRNLLMSFDLQLADLEQEIDILRQGERGANWIYKTSQLLISIGKNTPEEVVKAVKAMVKSRSNVLKKERVATEKEVEVLKLSQSKKIYYVEDEIAHIAGLEVLYEENDLKSLIIQELQENIGAFKSVNIDELSHSELSRLAKWVNSIEETKERIKNSLTAGTSLLKYENLKPFLTVINDKEDIKKFDAFIKHF